MLRQASTALEVWRRLDDGELRDISYPGSGYVVSFLATLEAADLVFAHADWLLKKGVNVRVWPVLGVFCR